MKTDNPENNFHGGLDPSFENGQSDAEKLMREHLQTPGHIITDEDLKSLKTTTEVPTPSSPEERTLEMETPDEEITPEEKPTTPWDVLGT